MEPSPAPRSRSRTRRARARRHTDWVRLGALAAFGTMVIVSPQLLGGALGWTTAVIGALALVALGAAAWSCRRDETAAALAPIALALAAALLVTVIQALPLPCSWVRAVAPESADQAERAAAALAPGSSVVCTITRDPGETQAAVVKGVAALAAFLSAWMLAAAGRRRVVLLLVVGSCVLMTAVALAHEAAGLTRVFGWYAPQQATGSHLLAPLMNENTLAGFLALGVPLMVAFGLRAERPAVRAAWIGIAVATAVAIVLTTSRGGMVALVIGVAAFALRYARVTSASSSRDRPQRRVALIAGAGVLAGGAILGTVLAFEDLRTEISGDLRKLDLARAGLELSLDHPWIGVGRGAFSSAIVETFGVDKRAVYAENFVVQWASEWGWPLTLGLLGVIAYAMVRAFRRARSAPRIAALCGLTAFAIQSLVDLGLEITGVIVVAAALLGATTAPDEEEGVRLPARPLRTSTFAWGALAVGAALWLGWGPGLHGAGTLELQNALSRHLEAGRRAEFRTTLERALELHPSEPAYALLAGAEGARHDDPAAMRWLNRTMELAPGWPGPHVEAARVLFRRGRADQALLEVREAARRNFGAPLRLMCWYLRAHPEGRFAIRAAPPPPNRVHFLEHSARCLGVDAPAVAEIDTEILRTHPQHVGARQRRAQRAIAGGRTREAIRELRALSRLGGADGERSVLLLAQALIADGRADEAAAALAEAERVSESPRPLVMARARALTKARNVEGMRRAIEELHGLSSASEQSLGEASQLHAQLEEELGNHARAAAAYEEAFRYHPEPLYLYGMARACEHMGDRRRAYQAYSRLAALVPDNPRFAEARDRLARVAESPLRSGQP